MMDNYNSTQDPNTGNNEKKENELPGAKTESIPTPPPGIGGGLSAFPPEVVHFGGAIIAGLVMGRNVKFEEVKEIYKEFYMLYIFLTLRVVASP